MTNLQQLMATLDKVDSPELAAYFQQFGMQYYANAAFLNLLKNTIIELYGIPGNGIPTLQQVNSQGPGTNLPLTVVGGGFRLDHESDGIVFTDGDGHDQKLQFLPTEHDSVFKHPTNKPGEHIYAMMSDLLHKADVIDGLIPAHLLPSFVDDVLEGTWISNTVFNNMSGIAYTPESGKIYVDVVTKKTYRWSGSLYSSIGNDLAIGVTALTAFRGDWGLIAYVHSQASGNPHGTGINDIFGLTTSLNKRSRTIHCDDVASSTLSGSTTTAVLKSYFIASNDLSNGRLEISADVSKAGSAGAVILQIFINSANTLIGATSIATYTSTNNTRTMPFSRKFTIRGGTQLIGFNASISAINDGISNSSLSSTSYDVSQGYYVMIAATLANAGDSTTQEGLELNFRKSA